MKFNRIYAVFLRQMYLFRHNWTRFMNIFAWIVVDIILWGFITKYLNSVANTGFNFVPMLLGAVILWDFLIRVQQGVILPMLEDVWSQNFLNFFASPLTIHEYMLGLVATAVITSTAGFVVIFVLAFVFGYSIFSFGLPLAFFVAILFLFGVALGIFTAGVVLRLRPSAEWIAWPIPAFISPLAGVFYPIAVLPAAFQLISRAIPASYVFEGMRQVVLKNSFSAGNMLVAIGLSLLYFALAYAFFVFIYRSVIRTGLITRFNAESATAV